MARLAHWYDLVLAVSEFTASGINRRIGHEWVKVLRNGVDTETFQPDQEAGPGVPTILYVGNMVPHKGAHHLLRAAARLAELGMDFRVRIVGSWGLSQWDDLTPYELQLRELARLLGERVTFLPFTDREDLPQVFREATIFCMPA